MRCQYVTRRPVVRTSASFFLQGARVPELRARSAGCEPLSPALRPTARALSLCACKEGKHGGGISSALYPWPEMACCSFSQCKVFLRQGSHADEI